MDMAKKYILLLKIQSILNNLIGRMGKTCSKISICSELALVRSPETSLILRTFDFDQK